MGFSRNLLHRKYHALQSSTLNLLKLRLQLTPLLDSDWKRRLVVPHITVYADEQTEADSQVDDAAEEESALARVNRGLPGVGGRQVGGGEGEGRGAQEDARGEEEEHDEDEEGAGGEGGGCVRGRQWRHLCRVLGRPLFQVRPLIFPPLSDEDIARSLTTKLLPLSSAKMSFPLLQILEWR